MEEAFSSNELIVPKKRTGPRRTDTFRERKKSRRYGKDDRKIRIVWEVNPGNRVGQGVLKM